MIEHEQKIRLHEAGWRERYYEVRAARMLRACWAHARVTGQGAGGA